MTILIFLPVFFFLFYFFLFSNKSFIKIFNDDDFAKPQSFHLQKIPRIGGLLIYISSLLIFFERDFYINQDIAIILAFSSIAFFIGLLDDIKFVFSPILKFFLFFLTFIILIIFFEIKIKNFNFEVLDYLNHFFILSILITFLAIFFVVNGSNLIDGFNGLLSIHSIIIFFIIINIYEIDLGLKKYLIQMILCVFLFLLLNFPKAKVFLGDAGAYFLGSNIALVGILLSNLNDHISPFLLANILFYLFFEIFFSVFRKIFQKKNPFYPDKNHLHMLLYSYISTKFNKKANPMTSLIINFVYMATILPSIIFYDNNFLCKIIFLFQIFIYMSAYLILRRLNSPICK